ncbi:MAG: 30S ribosome-binding factor RbfA [Anaerolineae bacterium]|uniref:Ribosome-binding factor A n=1 Tax=Candidatus Desulfolinea nitratireducens TaxID=2841698 RepID=A0A8J6TJL9_9CHLR|nr:30S ribosome-binding factor RbfA [Candidatus Desulfolinea nitratireducens]MBL6961647.1 30S ribosome-binding factor RbfA [Anaerolineales bacterium]NQU30629.1 30S ribosome-binding factor RbfA [Anaerolineae bacterium]
MPSQIRLQRISDRIRKELSEMLVYELSDPRLRQVFITDVNIDRELAYANIYISAVEGSSRAKEVLAGLESASGFIRRTLSGRVELRSFPRLRFHWDPTPEQADHIEKVLGSIREDEARREEKDARSKNDD